MERGGGRPVIAYVRRVSFFSFAGVTCCAGGGESSDSWFKLGSRTFC